MYAVLPIQSFRLKMLSLFEIAIEAFHNCALVLSWLVGLYLWSRSSMVIFVCFNYAHNLETLFSPAT